MKRVNRRKRRLGPEHKLRRSQAGKPIELQTKIFTRELVKIDLRAHVKSGAISADDLNAARLLVEAIDGKKGIDMMANVCHSCGEPTRG